MPHPTRPLRKLGFLTIGLFDPADPAAGHESTLRIIELGERLGFDSAWLTAVRAAGFSAAATASSRSRMTASASSPSAFSTRRALLPGTNSMLRKTFIGFLS